MRPSEKAWLALGGAVLVYEVLAGEGELLSEAFDRFLDRHPVLVWVGTVITAAHLLNILDAHPALRRVDPYGHLPLLSKRVKAVLK